jgi:hypothetical protein
MCGFAKRIFVIFIGILFAAFVVVVFAVCFILITVVMRSRIPFRFLFDLDR